MSHLDDKVARGEDAASNGHAAKAEVAHDALYSQLVESLGGIVWEADGRTFRFVFVSGQAERILGYPVQQWLDEPDFWRAHTHPDDVEWSAAFCADATAKRRNHEFEYRMIAADGRVVWLHDVVTVHEDSEGVLRLRGIMLDVTDRKRMSAALDERLRFETLLTELSATFANATSDAVDDTITEWLGRLVEFLDADRGTFFQVSGDPPIVYRTHTYARPGIEPLPLRAMNDEFPWVTEQLLQGRVVNMTNVVRDVPPEADAERDFAKHVGVKSGLTIPVTIGGSVMCAIAFSAFRTYREFPAELVARLRMVGEIFGNALIRKGTDETIRESEQLFRNIADTAPAMIFMMGTDGRPSFVNKRLLDYQGVSWEEFQSGHPADPVHPADRPHAYDDFFPAFEARRDFSAEFRMLRADGSWRWFLTTAVPRFSPTGEFAGYIGSCIDITERHEAEQHWRETSEQLRALSASQHATREEERTRIAREIHDELGSTLTSLRWDLESLEKMAVVSTDADPARAAAGDLRAKVTAMVGLVDETVNAVRRIASELRPSVLDDLGLAAAIEWQAQQFQARTGIACHTTLTVEHAVLSREQATATFRIFQEALTNVLRHAQATRVDVTLAEQHGEIVLTVRDDGKGISETQRAASGALGLLGMRERARLMGGTFEIAGREGHGTTVTVRLPFTHRAHA